MQLSFLRGYGGRGRGFKCTKVKGNLKMGRLQHKWRWSFCQASPTDCPTCCVLVPKQSNSFFVSIHDPSEKERSLLDN